MEQVTRGRDRVGRSRDQNGRETTTAAKLTRLREEGFEKVGEDKRRNAFCLRRIIGNCERQLLVQCNITQVGPYP